MKHKLENYFNGKINYIFFNTKSPSSQSEAFIKAISVSPSVSVSNYPTEPGSDDDLNDFQLTPSGSSFLHS